ncbi:MAG: BTAD domain-containing putative transcriptional regulator [Tissierellia bacterium]|nr:BTAD domain-containing putative transcriptional regulator [Tissierellia bacterium]
MYKLSINILGNVEIYYENKLLNSKLSMKSIGIIAMLLCDEHKKIAREKLAYTFWPECYETSKYNLRYNLWAIKKAIPNDEHNQKFLISDSKHCYINPIYKFNSDITFLENVSKDENKDIKTLEEVKKLFRGEFLENTYCKECDDFNDWIFYQRSNFQNMHIQMLKSLLNKNLKIGNYQESKNILEEILSINPYDEESEYKLLKLFIENNDYSTAIINYKKYENTLREDLNIFPQKNIKDLYLSITDNKNNKTANLINTLENSIVIRINEYADNTTDYFVLSDLLEKLILNCNKNILHNIPKTYLEDACLIQPRFHEFVNRSSYSGIAEVRLYHSIKSILFYLSKEYLIQIFVYNSDKIDKKSEKFLRFLYSTTNIYVKYVEDN